MIMYIYIYIYIYSICIYVYIYILCIYSHRELAEMFADVYFNVDVLFNNKRRACKMVADVDFDVEMQREKRPERNNKNVD